MPPDELEVAANRAFDEALDRMGADVCVYSVDLAIDEIRKRFGNGAIRRCSTRSSPPRHVTQV